MFCDLDYTTYGLYFPISLGGEVSECKGLSNWPFHLLQAQHIPIIDWVLHKHLMELKSNEIMMLKRNGCSMCEAALNNG